MDKHPIDDLFREHMAPREWPLTEDVWKEALMTIRKDKQKRRRAIWLWWFAGLTALATIIFIYSRSLVGPSQPVIATQAVLQESDLSIRDNEDANDEIAGTEIAESAPETQLLTNNQLARSVENNGSAKTYVNADNRRSPKTSSLQTNLQNNNESGSATTEPNYGSRSNSDLINVDYSRTALLDPLEPLGSTLFPVTTSLASEKLAFSSPVIQESFGTKVLKGGLISGFTIQSYSDIYAGLASKGSAFHDHAVRGGYQWAFNRNLGFEARTGFRFYSGDLPVHAQVAQVHYQIGSETTTFQLQADKLIMAGIGAVLHLGTGKHRIAFAGDVDMVIGAFGDFREQFISQESILQDRNAKPKLISEQRSWLALEGINRWQPTGEIAYRYAISPRFELGLAWLHRFNNFVTFDEIPSDRTTITIKKIF